MLQGSWVLYAEEPDFAADAANGHLNDWSQRLQHLLVRQVRIASGYRSLTYATWIGPHVLALVVEW